MTRCRYQIRFTKTGLLRWISHKDLARLWERMARRSALKLAMSEGFNPKARISFPSALALGTESLDEVVELELTEPLGAAEVLRQLASDSVEGLEIHQVCQLPEGFGKAQLAAGHFVLEMPEGAALDVAETNARINRLLSGGPLKVVRKGKPVTANVDEQIAHLRVSENRLEMVLRSSPTASLRPQDVLEALQLESAVEQGGRLVRVRTQLDAEVDPSCCASAMALPAIASQYGNIPNTPLI